MQNINKNINKKDQQDLGEMIKNRNRLKELLKELLKNKDKMKKNEIIYLISLFVFEVGIFEHWLKVFSYYLNKDRLMSKNYEEYLDKTTLGTAIIDIRNFELNTFDYKIKQLLKDDYKKSFIKACEKVNDLRNNLYHNLYKNGLSLSDLIADIRKRIETSSNVKYTLDIEKKDLVHKPLISKRKRLPKDWTIEMLIEILTGYYLQLVIKKPS